MDYSHILIKTKLSFDETAQKIKSLLNVAEQNQKSHQKEQLRFGFNIGNGEYYLFEILGLELFVIRNEQHVAIADESFPFYLTVRHSDEVDPEIFSNIVLYIDSLLRKAGFITQVQND